MDEWAGTNFGYELKFVICKCDLPLTLLQAENDREPVSHLILTNVMCVKLMPCNLLNLVWDLPLS